MKRKPRGRTIWCCHCCNAVWSRGEQFFKRELSWADLTDKEIDTDTVKCDWCDEEFTTDDELYVIKF